MAYSVESIIPQAYCEKFNALNVITQKDVPVYINALNIFDCTTVSEEISTLVAGETKAPSFTEDAPTNPSLVVMFGHILSNDDGVYTAVIGTPRREVVLYIESMINFLRIGDAAGAFSVMTLLSNSTKNIISENNATTRKKPLPTIGVTPCSL